MVEGRQEPLVHNEGGYEAGNEAGELVLGCALRHAAHLGDIVSAYAIGSLAHGGFAPLVSDVDLALVLDDDTRVEQRDVDRVNAAVVAELGSDLSRRLSIFWSTWGRLATGSGGGRFPWVDRLDLARDGRLLQGDDRRPEIAEPTDDQLVMEAATFMLDKFDDPAFDRQVLDPDHLLSLGTRAVVKAVLFPVRFVYTAELGGVASNPEAVKHWGTRRAAAPLVWAALDWRTAGIADPDTVLALLADLPAVYREVAVAFRARLEEMGEPQLAERISTWVGRYS